VAAATSQKTALFIVTPVKTSNLTNYWFLKNSAPWSYFVIVYQYSFGYKTNAYMLPSNTKPTREIFGYALRYILYFYIYCTPYTKHDGSGGKPSDLYSGVVRDTTILRLFVIFLSSSK
jgi:hypothetical protein